MKEIKGQPIKKIGGGAFHLSGDKIDTDRIIPARFLTCTSFDALGPSVFADDRSPMREKGLVHPFDDENSRGCNILVVRAEFGSGSSREHAPQALKFWGIEAIIGLSFAEIFAGSSVSIGLPCVTVSLQNHEWLIHGLDMGAFAVYIDLVKMEITVEHQFESEPIKCFMPKTHQKKLVEGKWDNLPALMATPMSKVKVTIARIPFLDMTALAP